MNELQYKEFGLIAQQCDSGQYRTINVASMIRSDAVVAVWRELERLRDSNNDLLAACEYGHSDDDGWLWLIFGFLQQNQPDDLAEKFRAKMQMECDAIAKTNQTD